MKFTQIQQLIIVLREKSRSINISVQREREPRVLTAPWHVNNKGGVRKLTALKTKRAIPLRNRVRKEKVRLAR